MGNLDRALVDIATIRSHLARGTEFRGYGPAGLALTALLAVVSAGLQSVWLPAPGNTLLEYLALWIGTAILAVAIVGIEAVTRSRRIHTGLADDMIWQAVEQFLPATAAGILVTLVLVRSAPDALWMLPGLWQIVLSLGMFASCRSLPRPMIVVPIWYMATGLVCLAQTRADHAFSPLAMGVPFGLGQVLAAILLQRAGGRDERA